MPEKITIAELLSVPFNRTRLDAIRHNEEHCGTSTLWRYRRMIQRSTPPPIVLGADGLTVVDGLHRLQIAAERGQETIEAIRK